MARLTAIHGCKTSKFLFIFIFLTFAKSEYIGVEISDKLLSELYTSYKEALNIDEGTVSFRRVNADNKKYQIHVMKLNEVNGHKRHNLLVKEDNSTNPIIYINNPVETKIPNAYLTYEEFKKELTDRVLRLRKEFDKKQIPQFKTTNFRNNRNKEFKNVKVQFSLRDIIEVKLDPNLGVKISKENKPTGKPIFRSHIKSITKKATLSADEVSTTTTNLPSIKARTLSNSKETALEKANKTTDIVPSIETSIEPPLSTNTESYTESSLQVKEQEISETLEPTITIKVDSTTTTATTEVTKKTSLSKPLVWMEGDMQKDKKSNDS